MIREGRSINGYKPSEYMVSKKCLPAWSELCFRISKLKSPHIKNVLETDNSEYKSYRISEKIICIRAWSSVQTTNYNILMTANHNFNSNAFK